MNSPEVRCSTGHQQEITHLKLLFKSYLFYEPTNGKSGISASNRTFIYLLPSALVEVESNTIKNKKKNKAIFYLI